MNMNIKNSPCIFFLRLERSKSSDCAEAPAGTVAATSALVLASAGVALHGGWGRPTPAPAHAATTLVGGLVAPPREPTTAAEAFWKMPHKGEIQL